MANAEIKILMLGARRAGKTSLLAAVADTFKDELLKRHLIIEETTQNNGSQSTLSDKVDSFKKFMKNFEGKTVLNYEDPTNTFHDYVIKVSLPGTIGEMRMTFTDANGEFYYQGDQRFEEIKQKILGYDVIIVAVDSVYLMESVNAENDLCSKTLSDAYNQVDSVHTLLSALHDDNGKNARLVIFAPVKCERWAKYGDINLVTQRVEESYSTTIKALKAFSNIKVLVLPVQTLGNVVFDSHHEAFQVTNKAGKTLRCTEMDESECVLLENGNMYKLKADDILQNDHTAIIDGYGFSRPNSWFRVINSVYAPHNCEQMAYNILHFLIAKTLFAKRLEQEKKKKGRWLKVLASMAFGLIGVGAMATYLFLSERMGTINIEKLQQTLIELDKKGLWKHNGEGIKVLNKGLLY